MLRDAKNAHRAETPSADKLIKYRKTNMQLEFKFALELDRLYEAKYGTPFLRLTRSEIGVILVDSYGENFLSPVL